MFSLETVLLETNNSKDKQEALPVHPRQLCSVTILGNGNEKDGLTAHDGQGRKQNNAKVLG